MAVTFCYPETLTCLDYILKNCHSEKICKFFDLVPKIVKANFNPNTKMGGNRKAWLETKSGR